MIVLPRVTEYLDALDPGDREMLEEIRNEALRDRIPIIRRETARFLRTMLTLLRPKEILEVGAAVGYSAFLMADASGEDSRITTIESFAPRIAKARRNLERVGMNGRITLLEGDAGRILPELLPERYDFIFMDAAKGQYLGWLPYLLSCLKPGGVLLSDNVLQEGSIAESRYAIGRRDRTIHERMREYLYRLTHTEELETSVLTVGDGLAMTVKKEKS
ncbi:methyltransferase [Lachnospiraceae bacterium]|nr:methyltransferase [Lachnospiraceae bacterium]